jgi:hypothetical protein
MNGIGGFGLRGTGRNGSISASGLAATAGIALGGTLAPGVVVGAVGRIGVGDPWSTSGLDASPSNVSLVTLALQGMVDWAPSEVGGFHVGAAIGLGNERLEIAGFDDSRVDLAVSAIAGYDWRLPGRWSLGVLLDASLYSAADLHDEYGNDTSFGVGVGVVTLAFTGTLY